MKEHLLLTNHLKTLKLPTMLKELPAVVRQSSEGDKSYEAFLERLAELEVLARQTKATDRRLRQASFPVAKDLADFDFKAVPSLNAKRVLDLARCDFLAQKVNVVLVGAPGLGKSHLAMALGREACRRGHRVKFFTAAGLVNAYLEARDQRQVLRLESHIGRCELIVIDELGYIPFSKTGAEHLFGFFSQCYERTSLIVTTNLPFAEWPQTFAGDERMAGAIIDRLTHRVNILEIKGDSYRLQASLKGKKGGTT
jgi:DNA replication protein DnaC